MNAPVTKLPKMKAKVGDVIEVPIKTTGMKNISAITLSFIYDKTYLQYIKTNLADELTAKDAGLANAFQVPGVGNENKFYWRMVFSQIKSITQNANESLCIITFKCLKAGTVKLEWQMDDPGINEYADATATVLPETEKTFVNGYIKIS